MRDQEGRSWSPRRLDRSCGVLALAAGSAHGVLFPAHLEEWWGYGLVFAAASAAQVLLGLALLTDAINPQDSGPGWWRMRRAVVLAGILGNLALIGLYSVTRTVGVPFFGPQAGEVEPVGAIDVFTKLVELGLVIGLVALWREHPGGAAGTAPAGAPGGPG